MVLLKLTLRCSKKMCNNTFLPIYLPILHVYLSFFIASLKSSCPWTVLQIIQVKNSNIQIYIVSNFSHNCY